MNLKLTIGIGIVALFAATMAVGQDGDDAEVTFSCPSCTHVAPVYMGEGGFLAQAKEDTEMVDVVVTCGNVQTSNELEPNEDGFVSGLFGGDNGLGCENGGSFEIGPVMDGGWYWIHGKESSATGGLVAKAVIDNAHVVQPTASPVVTVMKGRGASLLVHDKGDRPSGRMGILPTVLPVADADPKKPTYCGAAPSNPAGTAFHRVDWKCEMGDGGTMIAATGPTDPYTGKAISGTAVRRPLSGDPVQVTVDLWGNGSGHVLSYASTNGDARLGHGGFKGAPPLAVAATDGFTATVGTDLTGVPIGEVVPTADAPQNGGATFTVDNTTNKGTLSIYPDTRYCSPSAKPPVSKMATITVTANVDVGDATAGTGASQVVPAIVGMNGKAISATNMKAATATITVSCPTGSAAAHQGQELVPENPFPTDK